MSPSESFPVAVPTVVPFAADSETAKLDPLIVGSLFESELSP